ncbi:hypothetical protein SLEP1_g22191 [Rubroshorea leprosula]|uniref:Uncharacterized protein n=1 Tax=Rubroshorea leprosula TaxID=152421 RepID=A0AAV5JIY5_9ROSI|nr:hypothetical protein SLEP1_g22191 [Rubroshorea leprosula]
MDNLSLKRLSHTINPASKTGVQIGEGRRNLQGEAHGSKKMPRNHPQSRAAGGRTKQSRADPAFPAGGEISGF